ncbi:MAG TPA: class I SAM-dependent methyltransferase [Vicinamibacterales bacterium]|jgi:predicted methyltransferase|nr:class I SAM-dependent methyltransferase [Vicinamibacterales bacterium]
MLGTRIRRAAFALCLASVALISAQSRGPTEQEIKQAEHDVPVLLKVLDILPGMTVADLGAGAGAMTLVAARQLGPASRIYATDLNPATVADLKALAEREHLANVEVVQGAAAATNLPSACCDAIFMRDVYHHITDPAAMNRSIAAALKPSGRFAVIDFEAKPGSPLPDGVPANRGGHGVPPAVVAEEVGAASLIYVQTFPQWPEPKEPSFLVLFHK